jgi:hypothetical protein
MGLLGEIHNFAKNFPKNLCTIHTGFFLFKHSVKIHPKKNTICHQGFFKKFVDLKVWQNSPKF